VSPEDVSNSLTLLSFSWVKIRKLPVSFRMAPRLLHSRMRFGPCLLGAAVSSHLGPFRSTTEIGGDSGPATASRGLRIADIRVGLGIVQTEPLPDLPATPCDRQLCATISVVQTASAISQELPMPSAQGRALEQQSTWATGLGRSNLSPLMAE
jgi:hypothetical protein